jgi:small-conductance mechanosensitive channel
VALTSRSAALVAVGILAALVAAGALLYYVVGHFNPAGIGGTVWLRVLLTAGFGLVAVLGIERLVAGRVVQRAGVRWGGLVLSAYRFAAYAILAFAVLIAANVNSLALLAGGTFGGLVLGLASQTALSNIVSGVVLLGTRPMQPGDRVTLVTWQYAFDVPTYPPKFYSNDLLMPGYTGVVRTIGIVYSTVALDEGPLVKIPNSILLQAAVISHRPSERRVRTKFDVPATVEIRPLMEQIRAAVASSPWVKDPASVQVLVNHASPTLYVLSVDALCQGALEEPPRSDFLLLIADLVHAAGVASSPAPASPPPPAVPARPPA